MGRLPPALWGATFNFAGGGFVHLNLFPTATMPTAYKILGQLQPAADTWTDLYAVPAATQLTLSAMFATALTTSPDTFSVALAKAGAAYDDKQLIYANVVLNGRDTFLLTPAIVADATDVIRVKSLYGTLAFNLVGVEQS